MFNFMQSITPQFIAGFSFAYIVSAIQISDFFPFSQRFQTSFTWNFSNKKAPEFEITTMLAGNGSMMDQDSMSFVNATSTSSGRMAF